MRTLLPFLVAALSGCGGDDPGAPHDSGAADVATSETATSDSAGSDAVDAPVGDVPATAASLNAWLREKKYASFRGESAVHSSSGPHGKVRTFVNESLAASLDAASASHPRGAAAIKELYASDGVTLTGWAVEVKVEAESNAGKGWYWYEVFDTAPGATPVADGTGLPGCTGCHGSGARDYFKSPWPPP